MTAIPDLRAYLEALAALGDVAEIDAEVDPVLEVGAVTRLAYETPGPAPLFNRIAGQELPCRLLGAPAGLSSLKGKPLARVALLLGLPLEAGARQIIDFLAAARRRDPIAPRIVATAPCKQNVLLGEDADLDRFPAPLLHDGDGGRYLNTWGVIVTRTPDGSFTNWGVSRTMRIDGKRMAGVIVSPQHMAQAWQQWADRGQPMPYAMVQGAAPAVSFVGGMPLPDGVEEVGYLGALTGAPVELVRCETIDLHVPASAEIVVEGHVMPERTAREGPMGEFAGYLSTHHTSMQPVFTVEAITYRDNPIWPICVAGEPVDETHTGWGLPLGAEAYAGLLAADLPVATAWVPLYSSVHWLVVCLAADWRERMPGVSAYEICLRIAAVLDRSRWATSMTRTFVLDDDIDPANTQELMWAIATRVNPAHGHVLRHGPINPAAGCYTAEESRNRLGPKLILNGLLPAPGERNLRSSFRHIYPAAIQQRAHDLFGPFLAPGGE